MSAGSARARHRVLAEILAPLSATALVLTATAPVYAAAATGKSTTVAAPVSWQVSVASDGDAYGVPLSPDRVTGALPTLMAGDEALDGRVAYLRFTLPTLPVDASALAATLVLHEVDPSKAGTVKLWSVSGSWTQAALTARNAPSLDALLTRQPAGIGGAATTLPVPPARLLVRGPVAFAVTAFLGSADALAFAATENASAALRPALVLTYVTGAGCPLSAQLAPACGALIGSTANPIGSETTARQAVARLESELGRPLAVVHVCHGASDDWPTSDEVALATDPVTPRLLFVNWKPEGGHTWAEVAQGAADPVIDLEADRIEARLGGRPFLFTDHHEPEEEVRAAGTGMAAADYVAMFRHVVLRLRADGVIGLVSVWDVMGYSAFGDRGFYDALYPGDDVVDWVGYDPYSNSGLPLTSFADAKGKTFPGFYTWATTQHARKPLMLGEWGVAGASPATRAAVFAGLIAAARTMPALKAFVYFDHGVDATTGGQNYSIDTDPVVLAAARRAFTDPYVLH